MIHLYCGEGKGKTTAAMGLVLRWTGRGGRAVITQFLKGSDSGERLALGVLPGVSLLPVPEKLPFLWDMTAEERQAAGAFARELLWKSGEALSGDTLLVLDEVCGAVESGLLPEGEVLNLLERLPEGAEVVLTGRDPTPELWNRADYVTEMRAQKHPFERGISARKGVEY